MKVAPDNLFSLGIHPHLQSMVRHRDTVRCEVVVDYPSEPCYHIKVGEIINSLGLQDMIRIYDPFSNPLGAELKATVEVLID